MSALPRAPALESAEPLPAVAGLVHFPEVHVSPVAHGRFAEHDCPAVLGEAGVMHLPAEHVFPVSQSLANEHVALHTLPADVVAIPQILLVHSEAAEHETLAAFPCVAINVPLDAVLGVNFKLESGIVTFPVRAAKTPEPPAAGFAAHLQAQFPFGQSLCVVHEEGLFCPVFVIVCIPTCALSCGAILLYIRVPILAKADAETIEATIKIAITRAISVFPFILYPPRSCLHVCD